MLKKKIQLDPKALSCPICLYFLKNPVSVSCGHSYCMSCLKAVFDTQDPSGIYSCPQCREVFQLRPVLQKNTTLAEIVEELTKSDEADLCYAGADDVSCGVCSDRKLKAVKSCLNCLVSFCEKHLQSHYMMDEFKKHQLVEPSKNLQENICPHHDEVMKIFCRTDQQCICYLCLMEQHKKHETVLAAAEKAEKQKELEASRQQIQQRIQEREKDVKLLQQEVEAINVSADKTVEDSEKIFTQVIHLIQKRSSDVKQLIRSQQETEVSPVLELQEKLEQELTELKLKRKDVLLEELSYTQDQIQFLHNYPSVSALSEPPHSSSITTRPLRYFEDVTAALDQLGDKLQDVLRDTWTNILLTVSKVDVLLSEPEPKTSNGFLKYFRELIVDRSSWNSSNNLFLSRLKNRILSWIFQDSGLYYPISNKKNILLIGDVLIQEDDLETPGILVRCILEAHICDFEPYLNLLKSIENKRYRHIIIQSGRNDFKKHKMKFIKDKVASVCELAKTMSDSVIFGGPIPDHTNPKLCDDMLALNSWLSEWCPENNIGFVDHWSQFSDNSDLMNKNDNQPNSTGLALIAKTLDTFINRK